MTGLTGKRVLVVEDEYFLADDIAKELVRLGAEVLGPVGSQDEALRLLERERPDVVILDINLNGNMSLEVADDLAARDIPFVFATGYDGSVIPSRYAKVPRWEKPFDLNELLGSLLKVDQVSS